MAHSGAARRMQAASGARLPPVAIPNRASATAHKPDPGCDKVLFDLCFFYEHEGSPGGFLNGPLLGLAQRFDTLADPVFHSVDEGVDQRAPILRGAPVLAGAAIAIDLGEDSVADQVE